MKLKGFKPSPVKHLTASCPELSESNVFCTLLGEIAKIAKKKTNVSFFSCVCPSVLMEKLGIHQTDFHEIWYLRTFWKIR
jgi:hypothetical protein